MVKPALRRGWRDRTTVQFGTGPVRSAVLEGVDRVTEGLLDLLDGTRSLARLRGDAAGLGIDADRVDALLALLRRGGVLDDAEASAALHALPQAARERLRPDLASLSVVHPAPGAAPARLAARRHRRVRVHGAGRVGASIASLLAAAGIGSVEAVDGGRVEPWDVSPSGIPAGDVGKRRSTAAGAAVRRATPAAGSASGPGTAAGTRTDLVVLAPRNGLDALAPDPDRSAALMEAGVAHLYAGVVEERGIVGPLVVPPSPANLLNDLPHGFPGGGRYGFDGYAGDTAGDGGQPRDSDSHGGGALAGRDRGAHAGGGGCGGCLALHRAEADPAWPRLLAQLRSGRPGPLPPCDTALATTVAGLAAMHTLMFLDGGTPASRGGRVEVSLTDTSMSVRPVPRHPRCGCASLDSVEYGCASVPDSPAARDGDQVTMVAG